MDSSESLNDRSSLPSRIVQTSTSEVDPHNDSSATEPSSGTCLSIAIVDDRPLIRDCLGRSLLALEPELKLIYLSAVEEFDEIRAEEPWVPRILLLKMSAVQGVEWVVPHIKRLVSDTKVVVFSETESMEDILPVFECGASGYIPPSVGVEVAVKALQLVAAGGVYVPESILSCCGDLVKQQPNAPNAPDSAGSEFTSKQMAVIEALRRGKANKLIAYELNMCESTVKVHVRNVMKKLHAKNRTEAAYILNEKLNTGVQKPMNGHAGTLD